jgi:hypothetical protein
MGLSSFWISLLCGQANSLAVVMFETVTKERTAGIEGQRSSILSISSLYSVGGVESKN